MSEPDHQSPREILIRMLTERHPDDVAEVLRELGYDVQEPTEPASFIDRPLSPEDSESVLHLALELLGQSDAEAVDVELEIPGEVWMGEATEPEWGMPVGQTLLVNVHGQDKCAGRPCVLHNPSDHHMREWRLLWRGDSRVMERLCPQHGVGHPDPDDLAYTRSIGRDMSVHSCCGCCRPGRD